MYEVAYEAVLVDRIPNGVAGNPPTFSAIDRVQPLDNVTWSKALNNDGFASVSTRPENISPDIMTRLQTPDEKPMELWIYRRNVTLNGSTQKVFAGPVIGIQVQGRHRTVTFHARGLWYYTRFMFIRDNSQDYTNTDQFTIVKNLINHWQDALSWSHFGLDTSGISTSGVNRTIKYVKTDLINIGKAISELGLPDTDGFDFWVDPDTRDVNLISPLRGTDKSATLIIDNRNLINQSVYIDLTAGDFGTLALGTGTDPDLNDPLWSTADNATRRAQFGTAGIVASWRGVATQTTLDKYVQALVDTHSNYRITFGGAGGETEGEAQNIIPIDGFGPEDVDPGDTITLAVDYGIGEVTTARDVAEVVVHLDVTGNETMSVTVL